MGSEDSFGLHHRDYEEPSYEITSRIMISAIIVLVLVVWLIFLLHVYARWIWTQPARFSRRRRRRSASRRRGFHFTGQESEMLRNVGLDSAILETLPMFLYKSQNFRDGLECAVCLCELEENEKARLLPNCGHSFHVDCIDMWFLSHSTCPLCRTGAQPELPGLESAVMDQVSGTISGPIGSGSHENLDTEQGQSASSGDLQNPRAILSCDRQKQMNAGMDEGTSRGRTFMSLTIEIPKRQDVFSSPGEAHQPAYSPNGLKSPVARLRSLTRMLSRDTERIQVFPTNNPGECDAENNDQ